MALNTQIKGRILSVQKITVDGSEVTPDGIEADGKGAIYNVLRGASGNNALVDSSGNLHCIVKVDESFSGDIYENEHTMSDDSVYRFESSILLLSDVIIRVSTHDALVGDINNQRYPRSVGSTLGFLKVDLSKLYIKNAGAGDNTKINILGTRL